MFQENLFQTQFRKYPFIVEAHEKKTKADIVFHEDSFEVWIHLCSAPSKMTVQMRPQQNADPGSPH